MRRDGLKVAVAGATGAVGNAMLSILEERNFPVGQLVPLASERSEGRKLVFKGQEVTVRKLSEDSFQGIDLALFSAGASRSEVFAPVAVSAGAVVVDNSSAFRMKPEVPLVVPEVNPQAIKRHQGLIANPNCSTIQMVVALKPLHDAARIKRVVVSTYQSVSGAGLRAIEELRLQTHALLNGQTEVAKSVFPHQIAFNCLPHIDAFLENGYTKEEMKMILETKKIMEDESIAVSATTVRVPVFYAHSESVNIETERKLGAAEAKEILAKAPGIILVDDPINKHYPLAIHCAGKDPVFIGRVREDPSIENGLNLWIVADNLRKGAALNAIQIAELLIR
ncbi:MAG: aspartate-semialdehyde dehydrogenase [Nitrospinae bacterium RIFCSPLOWO2_12_FULL_45_22]|nr:MAG: aspartate-semialdehyde dehydrogenase [Nitrospinae bacterium RIFCSPLOWO2_12_FULL_45_22]